MMDLYQDITDRIIEALENGVVPWKKPWCAVGKGAFNRISGKPYSLLNQMSLKHGGEYATYDQWVSLGGRITQGAKAEKVVFWKRLNPEEQADDAEDVDIHELKKPKYVLRYYNVFPISSVTGVSPLQFEEEKYEHDRIKKAEELVKNYIYRENILLEEVRSNIAYYFPIEDKIHIPALSQFKKVEEYYSTVIHEMVHSTGHKKRLGRPGFQKVRYGSDEYSKEELVAEIGTASVLNGLGIESVDSFANSASYVDGWIQKLSNDKHLIVSAASAAEKAVKYLQ